jgi:single-stranded-DNA-specific exonuclease
MLPWQQLNGIEKATEMLYNALRETRIVVVGISTPTAQPAPR